MGENFLQRLIGKTKNSSPPSVVPAPAAPQRAVAAKAPAPARPAELIPGNFFQFEFFIELPIGERLLLGLPKICIRNTQTQEISWGSKLEWAWPNPAKSRVRWTDDGERGVNRKTLENPEDILGAEGSLGDMRLRFERILHLGNNQIVYALYCPEKNIRLAYGFARDQLCSEAESGSRTRPVLPTDHSRF
jgi:hypothetical protein